VCHLFDKTRGTKFFAKLGYEEEGNTDSPGRPCESKKNKGRLVWGRKRRKATINFRISHKGKMAANMREGEKGKVHIGCALICPEKRGK